MREKLRSFFRSLAPEPRTWHGAAWGLIVVTAILWLMTCYDFIFSGPAHVSHLGSWLAMAALTVATPLAGLLIRLLLNLLRARDPFFSWTSAACIAMLFLIFMIGGNLSLIVGAVFLLGAILIGGGIAASSSVKRTLAITCASIGAMGLIAAGVFLAWNGKRQPDPSNAAANVKVAQLTAADPSQPGPFKVRTLTYGSGIDKHRPEYAAGAAIRTAPVDGSAFVDNWKGRVGWARTRFWGFDAKKMPVQGRVWYPEGDGPFPLVLIVHGNHDMEDYSDPGYAYLGELMASRGFIFTSVDENFLNGSFSDLLGMPDTGLKEETDGRAWMLLEHVRVWKEWNAAAANPFHGKVDTEHIALLGHSRGGEAVAVAAVFNKLPFYPDNARIKLGYNHAIKAIGAIAPVDGQYKPAGISAPIENVNYFVLHGSADGDVQSFHGSRVYHRVKFSGDDYHFKSTLFINDANHGQFNTNWGRFDNGHSLAARTMNYAQIMPAADQQRVAKVYLSAFLEASLHDKREYLPLFQDNRAAAAWLPDGIYLHQFADSTDQMVSTYEEDIDVTTTTIPGGHESGERLCDWKERLVKLKWGDMDTRAVFLGWNAKESGGVASYTITLPPVKVDGKSSLIFSLSDAHQEPSPYDPDKKDDKKKDKDDKKDKDKDKAPIDLTIEVSDAAGETARLPLSAVSALQRQIETHVVKWDLFPGTAQFEVEFQSFAFPLAAFVAANPKLKPEALKAVRFVFNRTEKGVVILDDVGFGQRFIAGGG
jgi:dienelactone hydrolase